MKTEREYDENGRLFSIHNYGDESRSVEGNMTFIYYDENGRKESDIYYSAWYENGSHCEAVYEYFTYNGTGKLDRVDRKSEAGETVDYTIYEYDAQGMNCTRTCYLPDGTIDYRYEYRYDENGKKPAATAAKKAVARKAAETAVKKEVKKAAVKKAAVKKAAAKKPAATAAKKAVAKKAAETAVKKEVKKAAVKKAAAKKPAATAAKKAVAKKAAETAVKKVNEKSCG